jgi:hypothetical protein
MAGSEQVLRQADDPEGERIVPAPLHEEPVRRFPQPGHDLTA